jgi:hypothetical protein
VGKSTADAESLRPQPGCLCGYIGIGCVLDDVAARFAGICRRGC